MMTSCRSAPYREVQNPSWRIANMHLKSSYPKSQKKELQLESSHENTRGLHSQKGPFRTEHASLGTTLGNTKIARHPFGIISTNTLCSSSAIPSVTKVPTESSCETRVWNGKASSVKVFNSLLLLSTVSESDMRIYSGHDGEGPLDIWAVIKPGNTKEKIAIFAAQCAHTGDTAGDLTRTVGRNLGVRAVSMKIKSCWEVEGSIAKRRKWSSNPDRQQRPEHQKMWRESAIERLCFGEMMAPPAVQSEERHCREVEVDGSEGGRTLSVVEIVANFEQMACDQQVDFSKPCPLRSALPKVGSSLADQPGRLPPLEDRIEEGECVRVLDMVAKLDSECLKQQCEKEAGSLSRNNSLRRSVGRVLLAGTGACIASAQGQPEPLHELGEGSKGCAEATSSQIPSEATIADGGKDFGHGVPFNAAETMFSCKVQGCKVLNLAQDGKFSTEPMCPPKDERNVELEQEEVRVGSEPCVVNRQEPLPGSLFFSQQLCVKEQHTLPSAIGSPLQVKNTKPPESPCNQEEDGLQSYSLVLTDKWNKEKVDAAQDKDVADTERSQFPLRRMVSHEFLEMRFKIQLLLEPQQYMAFLPHHIMVKIFGLLPTKTLAALKCTCHYFKFIIESYGVRPADSRWVSDPRYKDDPCKQCKKRYGQGDVSLCRWHHKPYCQALPYGPGYWMCCHGSQKDTPGCNVGLHDNRWVPTFHNMPVYKKARDGEEDSS
ncbi:F-box only protein 34 isoform X2 [Scleropages formosus]|uniref:F-box only protein 34 isoform X2 n=1 Tax=Scleropages formosus TaxID=113540 RepID=UPI000878F431|nr:F-box only protein 34 isoform X2 [Scleropages formosus]XP_018619741.1 F-box only protein 34 isoform X2 [Scleropages formosus]XP_018619742.1 F-box only protein 34 isoform X2 [Scleropages formosus]